MEHTGTAGLDFCTPASTLTASGNVTHAPGYESVRLQPHVDSILEANLPERDAHSPGESLDYTTDNNNDTNPSTAVTNLCGNPDVNPQVKRSDVTSVEIDNTDDITSGHDLDSGISNDRSVLLGRYTNGSTVNRCRANQRPELLRTSDFHELYKRDSNQKVDVRNIIKSYIKRKCSRDALKKHCMTTFPVWSVLKGYDVRRSLASDIVAGLSVGIVQIPASMAFAMLATLPPICGLYTAFVSALVYFLFGTSSVVSVGSSATISLVVGTAVEKHEESFRVGFFGTNSSSTNTTMRPSTLMDDSGPKIAAATALTFLVAIVLVVLGKLRFGIVTSYMPDPMLGGFITSAMILVMISQVKVVLGLRINKHHQPFKCVKDLIEIGTHVHLTNMASLLTGAICLVVLYLVKVCVNQRFQSRLPFPFPIELAVVALGTVASHFGEFHSRFGVDIVGYIPSGLPIPTFPPLHLAPASLLWDAITVALIAYVISVSVAKTMAKKTQESIDPNQEMVAVGACSLGASLMSGYAVGVSLARTVVQESAGGKTQVASVVGSFVVLLVIISVGHLFYSLPLCVLAAVILIAFRGVLTLLLRARDHWRMSKYDFSMWAWTFTGVLCLGVDVGLVLGALVSLLTVIVRTQRLQVLSLGRIASSNTFVRKDVYKCTDVDKSIRIIHYNGPLYFANVDLFVCRFRRYTSSLCEERVEGIDGCERPGDHPGQDVGKHSGDRPEKSPIENTVLGEPPAVIMSTPNGREDSKQFVILDCSRMTFSDKAGVTSLSQVVEECSEKGITVYLAGLSDEIVTTMERSGVWEDLKPWSFVMVEGAVCEAERTIQDSIV